MGFVQHRGSWIIMFAALSLYLGVWAAACVLAAVVLEAFRSQNILSLEEKQKIVKWTKHYWNKIPLNKYKFTESG